MSYVLSAPRSSLEPAILPTPVSTTGAACLTNILTTLIVGRVTRR
jgi:hypothetical protein